MTTVAETPLSEAAQAASETLVDTITQIQHSIRQHPADAVLRVHLFQRYAQAGQWDKALIQLQVAAKLDRNHTLLAQAYRLALRAECLREAVFRGIRTPRVLGQPPQWLGHLFAALQADGQGDAIGAAERRAQALDEAPPTSGHLDGQAFEWIADADPRFGPTLEVYVNGDYYWLPFAQLAHIHLDAPADLRDLVWMPAQLTLVNGGTHAALLPARYPLTGATAEDAHLQSRLTSWQKAGTNGTAFWQGQGVKLLATHLHETSLLDARQIQLSH